MIRIISSSGHRRLRARAIEQRRRADAAEETMARAQADATLARDEAADLRKAHAADTEALAKAGRQLGQADARIEAL